MNDFARDGEMGGVGRSPPHNLDAERSALGGVLIKPSAIDDLLTGVQADDFFLPAHREVYEAMQALDQRRQPIDVVALADELKVRGALPRLEGGETYLVRLAQDVPTAENIGHYVRLVKEKATLRRLIGACAEIQSRAYGEFGNYEEFLDEAENAVFKVAQQTRKETYSSVSEMIGPVLESIEERARSRQEVTGVPTGFNKFDLMTAGLQPENLIIVAARPGVGKTSWAVNVAMNAAMTHKIPVLIFSLEMSKYELMERMLAGEARIDSAKLKRGQIEYSDWKNHIYPAGNRLSAAPILIDDSGAPSILDIRAKARRFRSDLKFFPPQAEADQHKRQHGLIIVDYLQLARGGGGKKDENREREIAEISRGLKTLAKDLKVPVIAVSQLNRSLEKREDKKPQLSDLRESGAIEQDADMIVFVHREEMYNKQDDSVRGRAELIIGKHRHGPTGEVPLTFIREYTRFENYAEELDEPL
ncbi:MAG TPA: replicative DNA helicase [Polyangia bacterium]